MTYDHNDFNRMVDQNLDQNSHTSDQKMDKKSESSIKAKAVVRFSEPIAEYRLISDAASSSSSIYSDTEQIGDESLTDSWDTKGLKKCLWKLLIYVCMFIFIGIIFLCGFFTDNSVVQNVIFPVGVVIVFCFLFYRAVSGSNSGYSSGSSVLGFSQREDLEEDLLEGGYENYMQSVSESVPESVSESVSENDIKSSI
jgi:hypothetical protein